MRQTEFRDFVCRQRPIPVSDFHPRLAAALESAVRLHDFIRSNTGENSDWPLRISSDTPGAVERLDTLLREFRDLAVAAISER
jgi:hypothetical protein